MSHPNIFEVINKASSHVEIYHSAFLESMLQYSLESDRGLFDAFWRMAAPGWSPPEDKNRVTIKREDNLGMGTGRVDLALLEENPPHRVLGVEVKTQGTSTTPGQLERYRKGLSEKYPRRELAIAFLTPFNRERAGDVADALPSVKEFDRFHDTFRNSVHLSWLDLAEIDWDGGELWGQHRAYVRESISSPGQLAIWDAGGRSRQLADVFGEEAVDAFEEHLDKAIIGDPKGGGYKLDLKYVRDPAAFANAFRKLIESDVVRGSGKAKRGTFTTAPDDLKMFLKAPAPAGEIHLAIFQLAAEYENAWIQGAKNYALRVAHPNFARGMSLLTSYRDGKRVRIVKPNRIARPE